MTAPGRAGLVVLGTESAAQVATALHLHRQYLDVHHLDPNRRAEHPAVTQLYGIAQSVAIRGQNRPAGGMRAHTAIVLDVDVLVDLPTAAQLVGVSTRTIRRRIEAGELAAVHCGRRLYVDRFGLTT